jgi:ArsR family transcriptional regulator, lead/cadmium/zinc/bismuth-responsive transcriptional repressor
VLRVFSTVITLSHVLVKCMRYPQGTSCTTLQSLTERSLLDPIAAGGLAAVFKVLANDTRLRILHAILRQRELSVNELARTLAMKPQAVSNQLQRLSDLGIVTSRREGTSIIYRVVDRCVSGLLEQGWCLVDDSARANCCEESE